MKKMSLKLALVFSVGILTVGCADMDQPKYTVLQDLRVLALELNAPEVGFDGTSFSVANVQLTPWVSDVHGGGRILKADLEFCLDPGVSQGAVPSCENMSSRTVVYTGQTVVAGTTNAFQAPNYSGSVATETISLPVAQSEIMVRFAIATPAEIYNGLSLLLVYKIYAQDDPANFVTAFKRLVFSGSTKTVKNSNPSGLQILNNGVEISSLPAVDTQLVANMPSGQAESYSAYVSSNEIRDFEEKIEVTWFLTGPSDIPCSRKKECTTDGLFFLSRSLLGELNWFYAPKVALPTDRGRVLIGVARDGRGGIDITRYVDGLGP